jgi:uncharacterized protein
MTAHPFVWHDLMTPDPDTAETFYSHVIGWRVADAGMPDRNYRICHVGDNGVAGLMGFRPKDDKKVPPFWSGYIYTPDVAAAATQALKLGGTIFREPQIVPDTVEFAILCDPHGAMFNIMRPLSVGERPTFAPGTPGTMGWNELHSGDWQEAWEFYATLFGWVKKEAIELGPMGTYQTFGIGEAAFGGMMNKVPDMPRPAWLYYWNVDAIDAAIERINASGGKVIMGPHQVPGGSWIVNAMDPQGGVFALVSTKK